jgi:hypothetical protein
MLATPPIACFVTEAYVTLRDIDQPVRIIPRRAAVHRRCRCGAVSPGVAGVRCLPYADRRAAP